MNRYNIINNRNVGFEIGKMYADMIKNITRQRTCKIIK